MLSFTRSASSVGGAEKVEDLEGGRHDGWGDAVREEVGAGPLAEEIDDFLAPGGVASGCPAKGLAKGGGGEIDLPEQPAVFVGPASPCAEKAGGVGVVEVDQRAVAGGELVDFVELGNHAVHGEDAIRGDELVTNAGVLRFLQFGLKVGHVVVGIAVALSLAEAHPVDDGGVVERV